MVVTAIGLSHLLGVLQDHLTLGVGSSIGSSIAVVHAHIQMVVLVVVPLLTARVQYSRLT